jgi:hypothetical protein
VASQILVQKPRQDGEDGKEDLAIHIVSVQTTIDSISLMKAGREVKQSVKHPFEFDVDIDESARTKDSLSVKYSFTFGRQSAGQVCKVSGGAVVRFTRFNPSGEFQSLGEELTNEIVVAIFRKNFESVYLLHDAMRMESPSPWITQDVSLSSRTETQHPDDDGSAEGSNAELNKS